MTERPPPAHVPSAAGPRPGSGNSRVRRIPDTADVPTLRLLLSPSSGRSVTGGENVAGDVFGPYRLIELLGRGGNFGEIDGRLFHSLDGARISLTGAANGTPA